MKSILLPLLFSAIFVPSIASADQILFQDDFNTGYSQPGLIHGQGPWLAYTSGLWSSAPLWGHGVNSYSPINGSLSLGAAGTGGSSRADRAALGATYTSGQYSLEADLQNASLYNPLSGSWATNVQYLGFMDVGGLFAARGYWHSGTGDLRIDVRDSAGLASSSIAVALPSPASQIHMTLDLDLDAHLITLTAEELGNAGNAVSVNHSFVSSSGFNHLLTRSESPGAYDFQYDNVVLTELNTVPEPSSMLLGLCAAALALSYTHTRSHKAVLGLGQRGGL